MITSNGDLRHCVSWGLNCTHVQLLVMVVSSMFGNPFVLKAASSPGVTCTNSASTRGRQAIFPQVYRSRAHLTYRVLKSALPQPQRSKVSGATVSYRPRLRHVSDADRMQSSTACPRSVQIRRRDKAYIW